MGDVHNACINYQRLLNTEYNFILGRKQNKIHIKLQFSKIEFHHICGLHKLVDIYEMSNPNRKQIFDDIFYNKISLDTLKKSCYYPEIDERVELVENLEKILDSNNTVFKFNNRANAFSLIDADYILKNSDTIKNMYIFISKEDKNSDTYFCRSAFTRDKSEKDYTAGHTPYTLLYKEKEMWIEAADTLRRQFDNCPEEMKKYIGYELKNLEINIDKKFAPKRQQTFDELSKAAKENYIKLQKDKETVGIVSSHSDKNRNER